MWKDKLGRALMWLIVALTIVAFLDGIRRMGIAAADRIWVETWRTFGFMVFTGLFALIALRPRNSPGLWELTFGHKVAVVIYGLCLGNAVPEVSVAVKMDLALVVMSATAWVLCRGWLSWAAWRAPDPAGQSDDQARTPKGVIPAPPSATSTHRHGEV